MLCLINIISVIVLSISQTAISCDYKFGEFEYNGIECMFECGLNSGNYVSKSSVTFEQIKENKWCTSVAAASVFYPSHCSNLDDLIWATDSCSCPYCKCSTENKNGEIEKLEKYLSKTCYNCTCSLISGSNNTDLVYQCETLLDADSPREWDEFSCPPSTCLDSNGNTRNPGHGWFDTVELDTDCNKYCYCNGDGTTTCIDGFSSIMESTNNYLVESFLTNCKSQIEDCINDPLRMFTSDTGPSCTQCPKCDCNSYSVGNVWYSEYLFNNELTCSQCQCKEESLGNYTNCYDEDSYLIGAGECPPKSSINCHQEYSDISGTVGTLNTQICASNVPNDWCTWTYSIDSDGDKDYRWNCNIGDNGLICQAFGSNNNCIYHDSQFSYIDCDGSTQNYTFSKYLYCCEADDECNHKDIDINACTENTEWANIWTTHSKCLYENYFVSVYQCDDDAGEIVTCDGINAYYSNYYGCYCELYANLYNNIDSTQWKIYLQNEVDQLLAKASQWNDAVGCNLNLKCNLEGGTGVYNDNKTSFTTSTISATSTTSTTSITVTESNLSKVINNNSLYSMSVLWTVIISIMTVVE